MSCKVTLCINCDHNLVCSLKENFSSLVTTIKNTKYPGKNNFSVSLGDDDNFVVDVTCKHRRNNQRVKNTYRDPFDFSDVFEEVGGKN